MLDTDQHCVLSIYSHEHVYDKKMQVWIIKEYDLV